MNSSVVTYDFAQALEHTNAQHSRLLIVGIAAVVFSAILPPVGALIASSTKPLSVLNSQFSILNSPLSLSLPHDDEQSLASYFRAKADAIAESDSELASRLSAQAIAILPTANTTPQQIAVAGVSSVQETSTQAVANTPLHTASIAPGATSVFVADSTITGSTPIALTSQTQTNAVLSVTAKEDGKGFTVSVTSPSNEPIVFQWHEVIQ